ncbi:hypothetical protein KFE98_02285 [bacterium SCSIO 12741]|nr:hypothetical protein KFE98_02285 [bacterium SCSIO 12741]
MKSVMTFSFTNLRFTSLFVIGLVLLSVSGCKKSDPIPKMEWSTISSSVFPGDPIILNGTVSDESQVLYADGVVENQAGDTVVKLFFKYPFESEYKVDVSHYFNASLMPKGNYTIRVRVIGSNGEITETYPLTYKEHPGADSKLTVSVNTDNNSTYIDAYDLNGTDLNRLTINDDLLSSGFTRSKLFVCADFGTPTLYMVDLKTQNISPIWSSNASFHNPRIYSAANRVYLSERNEYIYGFDESGAQQFSAQLNGANSILNMYQIEDVLYIYYNMGGYNWIAAYQVSSNQLIRNTRLNDYCHYMFGAGNENNLYFFYFNDYFKFSSQTGNYEYISRISNESYEQSYAYQYDNRCFIGMQSGQVYAFSEGGGLVPYYAENNSFSYSYGIKVNAKSGFSTIVYADRVVTMNIATKSVYLTRNNPSNATIRVYPIELD